MIRFNSTFDGQSIKRDGTVSLTFRAPLSEIADTVKLVTLLETTFHLRCVNENDEPVEIGKVTFFRLQIDRQGESRVMFETELSVMANTLEEIRSLLAQNVIVEINQ